MAASAPAAASATRAADANTIMAAWFPGRPVIPVTRVYLPPTGQALDLAEFQAILMSLCDEFDATSVGNFTGAALPTNVLDAFLMHLGHTGCNWKAGENAGTLKWIDGTPARVETRLDRLYAVLQRAQVTPRQFAATVARRLSDLADEFQVLYTWGANRGILMKDRRISHPVADQLADLSPELAAKHATASAAAIQSSVREPSIGVTVDNLLHAPAAPSRDPLHDLQARLRELNR
jgi:hypothetical protein